MADALTALIVMMRLAFLAPRFSIHFTGSV